MTQQEHLKMEKKSSSPGQLTYERDLAAQPHYGDGAPRPGWDRLGDVAKDSWERNPTDRQRLKSKVELDIPGTGYLCYDGRPKVAAGIFNDGSLNIVGSDIGDSFTYEPESDEWSFRFGLTKAHDFDFEHSLEVKLSAGSSDDGADDRWALAEHELQSSTWLDLLSANASEGKLPVTKMTKVEVYAGYIQTQGVRLQVDFELPVGATSQEKDAAFVVSLAQQVDLNYLVIGELEVRATAGKLPSTQTFQSVYDAEITGLNKRQLTAHMLRIGREQAKRERLLADPAELVAYAEDKGILVDDMRTLLQANYRNNAPRLSRYKDILATIPDAPRAAVGWHELEADPSNGLPLNGASPSM